MKHSIARKVTWRVSIILITALAVLFVGSYFLVQNMIYIRSQKYSRAIVTVFSDWAAMNAANDGEPIDIEHTDKIIQLGEYLCKWYDIDYAYMYIPNPENNTVTYIAAAQNEKKTNGVLKSNMVGATAERILTDDEISVWNGEEIFGTVNFDNQYGREIGTVLRFEDTFGNKILAGIDVGYGDIQKQILRLFLIIALIIILVLLGLYVAVYFIIKKQVSQPAQILSKSMQEFLDDGKRSKIKLNENDSDEYSMIAGAFNQMSDNIDSYLENIGKLTREQEHQNTELNIAARIQKGFLAKENFESDTYEIRASMNPAKNVGGDLYDYLPIDEHRVLLVIADVSGKGIAASLFMVVTLILIRQYAKMNLSPSEILEKTNDTLSGNNPAMLFATAFVAIYDSDANELTYSNAGHNMPYIISDKIHVLNDSAGLLLGLFGGEKYSEKTFHLNTGDTVFMYTDGVNEAVNEQGEFFGTERLENELEYFRKEHGVNPVAYINEVVKEYAGASEQHDDITMITITVKETTDKLLNVDLKELNVIRDAILSLPIPRAKQLEMCLSAEECFVNICSYAFKDKSIENEKIRFTLNVSDRIIMRFEDGGQQFNPLEHLASPENYDIETQIGGLGNYIAVSKVDDVKYEYKDRKNILTFTKYF